MMGFDYGQTPYYFSARSSNNIRIEGFTLSSNCPLYTAQQKAIKKPAAISTLIPIIRYNTSIIVSAIEISSKYANRLIDLVDNFLMNVFLIHLQHNNHKDYYFVIVDRQFYIPGDKKIHYHHKLHYHCTYHRNVSIYEVLIVEQFFSLHYPL